jgi:hypothetical protein
MQRFNVQQRDVPAAQAARRLGLELSEFDSRLPALLARGFPAPDPDTGHYDLQAIDRWCDSRHAHLFGEASAMQARDASAVAKGRIAELRRGSR